MPALVRIENGEQISVEINKSKFVIGRLGKSDLVLADRRVSREHALITEEDGFFFLTDLDSSNGTHLNGRPIEGGPYLLRDESTITLGQIQFTFVDDTLVTDNLPSPEELLASEIYRRNRSTDTAERIIQDLPATAGMHFPVFISHSSKDDAFVTQLANYLFENSIIAWVDHVNIAPGKSWSSEIEKTLKDAQVLIVVLSPDANNSKSVEAEWSYFRDQDKPIYPVKIAPCPTPLFLYTYQLLDLTANQENGLARLLHTLRTTLFGEGDESA
ncbi:MAG: TIR domain-containing protein [Anaerolineae bacterium]|nr:TIR domain-containing protein [Anaerolineae bacterium]